MVFLSLALIIIIGTYANDALLEGIKVALVPGGISAALFFGASKIPLKRRLTEK